MIQRDKTSLKVLPRLLARELKPGPNCYACRKPICRGIDSLQCQAKYCTNESHKQLSCRGFHRSQLIHPWRCPPHRDSALLTEHPQRHPYVTAVNSTSTQVSGPSHVPIPTVHALSTLQGYAVPVREGRYAGSMANQTAALKQSLACRSPGYSSKSRII